MQNINFEKLDSALHMARWALRSHSRSHLIFAVRLAQSTLNDHLVISHSLEPIVTGVTEGEARRLLSGAMVEFEKLGWENRDEVDFHTEPETCGTQP